MDVKSPDQSNVATFALAVWVTGAPVATDSAPNSVAPSNARILRVTPKRAGVVTMGNGSILAVASGGSGTITYTPWFFDNTINLWVQYQAAATGTITSPGNQATTIRNMSGAQFFLQITANTGNATAFGYDFV